MKRFLFDVAMWVTLRVVGAVAWVGKRVERYNKRSRE